MDFRDKLLSSEVRHVTELVNMLSYELVILQDFLTEEFGRKYKRFRSTHVFASESTQDLSQTRGGASTSIGRSKTVENTQREFRSEKRSSQSQQDPLGENKKSTNIVILQNPDTNPTVGNLGDESDPPSAPVSSVPEGSHVPINMDTEDEVKEQYETKLMPETAVNSSNKNSNFDDELDSESETSSEEGYPRSSWTKTQQELEAKPGPYCKRIWDYFEWKKLPDGRKIVRCPKCKVNVSAVAKRMQRHRERCTGEGRLSFAGMKREDITASSINSGESSLQGAPAPTQPIDTTPRTIGKPKGLVWSHFEKICTPDNQVIVKCKYCKRKVSNHATRMARHLHKCEQSPVKDPNNMIDDSLGADADVSF